MTKIHPTEHPPVSTCHIRPTSDPLPTIGFTLRSKRLPRVPAASIALPSFMALSASNPSVRCGRNGFPPCGTSWRTGVVRHRSLNIEGCRFKGNEPHPFLKPKTIKNTKTHLASISPVGFLSADVSASFEPNPCGLCSQDYPTHARTQLEVCCKV